jgi:plastocyanin
MRNIYLAVLWSLSFGLTACNSKAGEQAKTAASAPQEYTTVDPATAATIRGIIKFNGKAPAPREIDMSADPACQFADGPPGPKLSEQYVVNDGKLANVYVYIKEGLEGKNFAPLQAPAVLDQRGCRYHPHVLAMMAGQPLRILNSDPATHNVHPSPKVDGNHEWNVSQMPKGDPVEKTFTQPEIMMPVQCNQHNWMKAFINVSRTPFFAVSDAAGNFEIKGLPPGEYTVAAVHENAGEQTQKITVGPSVTKQVEFVFGRSR